MRLIGLMVSPYVRRVAISLELMRMPFEHKPLSVFRDYDRFAEVNPVVKAPTLITDEGIVLMESTLILEHLIRMAPERSLFPADPRQRAQHERVTGLALAACEKTVQLVYEFERPQDRQHEPWIARVRHQLIAAYRLLDELSVKGGWLFEDRPTLADVSAAVAFSFTRYILPREVAAADYAGLAQLALLAESLPEFRAWPMT